MLSRIFIQNFALIDSLEIHLNRGLQVITGETGAGKSIILGALRLLMGERVDAKAIQNTEAKSIVEGEFRLQNNLIPFFEKNDLDFESSTIIRREILVNGKSRAFINDVPTTLDVLKSLSEQIIDIHSQFETSHLFSEKFQFEIIDGLGNNFENLGEYQKEFSHFLGLKKTLDQLKNLLLEGTNDVDYKNFLLDELLSADLDTLNIEELESQLSLYENAEIIVENLNDIFSRTDQDEVGVIDALLEIKNKLTKTAELSHQFSENQERMETLFLEFKDLIFDLQNKAEKVEVSPEVLLKLNERLSLVNGLMQKHRVNSVEELIEIRDRIQSEQSNFDDLQSNIENAEKELKKCDDRLEKQAVLLSEIRKKNIPVFKNKIETLLQKLGLEKAKLDVELTPTKDFNLFGKEKIQILFQANSGFALKPIQSAISGGERSRVMLAVKKIMAENTDLPTLILDEIDTGVSGKVADEIGKVMQEMSQDMQLIVISHLAQVAAKGNDNYKVVKSEIDGKTRSNIVVLTKDEKLKEIAQLLSGSVITDAAMKQAEELMK
ncbi:DNA repair protein RecN [Amniculibacterium aquaticum]|uniref:DNA repair protein RecN n=1 Tax=Amniculibacterium aquaticum TaxID=2479858 RepID=UPI000F5AA3B8|nr:DNA repair protein RecN [Amniculibacterium aquaticum]